MKKFLIAAVAGLSMMVSACGPQAPYQGVQQAAQACVDPQGNPADCVQNVAQQGGSFVSEHPLATAAIVGGGAYMLGKRNANRQNYGYGYRQPRTVVRRTVYRNVYRAPAVSSYRSYSRPSYTTRTTTYRRR